MNEGFEAAPARLHAQLLHPPGLGDVEKVVGQLLAVQAQDPRAFRLALRARSHGTSAHDVDTALTERRLVVSWLFRGTLHLVRSADYWWLHTLTAPRIAVGNRRRLTQLGLDEATTRLGVQTVRDAVAAGPKTRAELRSRLDTAGVPTAGQALAHVLIATTLREHLIRGPMRDGEPCFVDARRWLPRPPVPDRDRCLGMLAHRYLAGHGPATPADLAAYTGLTLTDARRGFSQVATGTRQLDDGVRAAPDADRAPPPRLLGMFDPVLHGWADRSFITGADQDKVVTANGLFRATALVGGRVAGTWTLPGGVVTLNPLRRLSEAELGALKQEAASVLRYLGLPPAPLRTTGT